MLLLPHSPSGFKTDMTCGWKPDSEIVLKAVPDTPPAPTHTKTTSLLVKLQMDIVAVQQLGHSKNTSHTCTQHFSHETDGWQGG